MSLADGKQLFRPGNDDQIVPCFPGGKGVISVLSQRGSRQTHDICAADCRGCEKRQATAGCRSADYRAVCEWLFEPVR